MHQQGGEKGRAQAEIAHYLLKGPRPSKAQRRELKKRDAPKKARTPAALARLAVSLVLTCKFCHGATSPSQVSNGTSFSFQSALRLLTL
jgi:hypothetical protein